MDELIASLQPFWTWRYCEDVLKLCSESPRGYPLLPHRPLPHTPLAAASSSISCEVAMCDEAEGGNAEDGVAEGGEMHTGEREDMAEELLCFDAF